MGFEDLGVSGLGMVDLAREVSLTECATGAKIMCQVVPLTRALAKRGIDSAWWQTMELPKNIRRGEPDHVWRWADLHGEVRADHGGHAVGWAIASPDNAIQSAILYSTNSRSLLDVGLEGEAVPAVYVNYLAVAPWNRYRLTKPEPAKFQGVGTSLLRLAIAHSHFRQGEGRINLVSVRHPDTVGWYQDFGFVRVEGVAEDRLVFELSREQAANHLREMGL